MDIDVSDVIALQEVTPLALVEGLFVFLNIGDLEVYTTAIILKVMLAAFVLVCHGYIGLGRMGDSLHWRALSLLDLFFLLSFLTSDITGCH